MMIHHGLWFTLCVMVMLCVTGMVEGEAKKTCAPWAPEFSSSFWSTEGNSGNHSPGMLYYTWNKETKAVRVDHGAEAHECIKFYGTSSPCTEFFVEDGMIISIPSSNTCCLSVPGVGPNPPDWTTALNYTGHTTVDGIKVDTWVDGLHKYWNQAPPNAAVPMLFTFPNSTQDYHFIPSSYTTVVDPSVFTLPSSSCHTPCPPSP